MAHEHLIEKAKKAALKENLPPKEIEKYFLHEGMDRKEAKHASEQIKAAQILESAKKAEKERKSSQTQQKAAPNQPKSSILVYIVIVVIIGIIAYLYYSGILNFNFINFK